MCHVRLEKQRKGNRASGRALTSHGECFIDTRRMWKVLYLKRNYNQIWVSTRGILYAIYLFGFIMCSSILCIRKGVYIVISRAWYRVPALRYYCFVVLRNKTLFLWKGKGTTYVIHRGPRAVL